MGVDTFTNFQFNQALPVNKNTGEPLAQHVGVVYGENCWRMRVKKDVYIFIRSSIEKSGMSADCGENSIRAYLVDYSLKPLGSKVQKFVTRVPGWQKRLTDMLRELYSRGQKIEKCPTCGKLKGVYKVKKDGKNKGRLFQNCFDCDGQFKFLS